MQRFISLLRSNPVREPSSPFSFIAIKRCPAALRWVSLKVTSQHLHLGTLDYLCNFFVTVLSKLCKFYHLVFRRIHNGPNVTVTIIALFPKYNHQYSITCVHHPYRKGSTDLRTKLHKNRVHFTRRSRPTAKLHFKSSPLFLSKPS